MDPRAGDRTASDKLHRIAAHALRHVRHELVVVGGDATVAILETARRIAADLIVMGSTRSRPVLFGRTAERVLRESRVPVLIRPAR